MKKFLFLSLLVALTAFHSRGQTTTNVVYQMNNPSNSSGSASVPDTTRAVAAYKFNSPKINAGNTIIIECTSVKDSGTVAGYAVVYGSNDTTGIPDYARVDVDSLTMSDGDNFKRWVYTPAKTPVWGNTEQYWQVYWYVSAKSRSHVKCVIRAKDL